MSTYYKFVCKKHNISGGFLTGQAGGTGNFDIIETFKFLGLHKDCEPVLYAEQTKEYEETPSIDDCQESMTEFIEDSKGIIPHSNDWELVEKHDWKEVEGEWEKIQLEKWFPNSSSK